LYSLTPAVYFLCADINVYTFGITESQSGMQPKLNALPTAQKMKWKILLGAGSWWLLAGKRENKKEINEQKGKALRKGCHVCARGWGLGSGSWVADLEVAYV